MSEFAKLRTGTDLSGRLLRAGMRDAPNGAARRAAEKALGLSCVTTAAAAAPVVAVHASSKAALLGAGVLVRWFGWGLLAGAITSGGALALAQRVTQRADVVAPVSSAALGGNAAGARVKRVAMESGALSSAAASAVSPTRRALVRDARSDREATGERGAPRAGAERVRVTVDAPSSTAVLDSALSRELALLEAVREKVRRGDAPGALAELDRVASDVHLLANEAQLLRVEALLEHGERARAEALAAELERENPGGAQGFRLRRLLGAP